jgi:hypothetical protein
MATLLWGRPDLTSGCDAPVRVQRKANDVVVVLHEKALHVTKLVARCYESATSLCSRRDAMLRCGRDQPWPALTRERARAQRRDGDAVRCGAVDLRVGLAVGDDGHTGRKVHHLWERTGLDGPLPTAFRGQPESLALCAAQHTRAERCGTLAPSNCRTHVRCDLRVLV